MRNTLRVFFCVITILNIVEASYKVTMFGNKNLRDCSQFQKTSETTIGNCLARCLENCMCRSFRMCNGDKTCSLCLSNVTYLQSTEYGCGYFALERNLPQNGAKVRKSCLQDTNCCLTSQPCLNNGLCKPSYPSDILHSPRFTCACAPGFHGNRCEQPIKSCRGYINFITVHINDTDVPASGIFSIIDDTNKPFHVFCDFSWHRDAIISWTLVQSYQLQNKARFQTPFYTDSPITNETPNWNSYRLSLSRIKSIQRDSSKWRMTCRYETNDGQNHTDYIEGLKSEIDILQFSGSACKKAEFINVRGYNCTQCEARMKQKRNLPFHHDSYRSNEKCNFKPKNSTTCPYNNDNEILGEDNFGWYKCTNTAHRCSMDNGSTSQTWLGREFTALGPGLASISVG